MQAPESSPRSFAARLSASRDQVWHLALLLVLACVYHAAYTRAGLNLMDEGWPLSAARALHLGGTMYDQVFWVFPPGHVLAAWLGWAIDPPGQLIARWVYSFFDIALVVTLYFLARRVLPSHFALLAGLLLVVAAPDSHRAQGLFAYRYLVWSALALLCFDARLRGGSRHWLFAAGALLAVAACFRTTPAFAAGCAIGFGVIFSTSHCGGWGGWRDWIRDWLAFGAGIAVFLAPVLVWFQYTVGLAAVWDNVFVRAVVMTAEQAKPIPDIVLPDAWGLRLQVKLWFIALQFRLHPLVYTVYTLALGVLWLRAVRRRERFEHVLLFAIVIWGALFFVRSLGRSDWAHLDSAVPPMCLLGAHALWLGLGVVPWPAAGAPRRVMRAAGGLALLAAWVFLLGSDLPLRSGPSGRPTHELRTSQGPIYVAASRTARRLDSRLNSIRKWTDRSQTILDLSASPGFHALADRDGPGYLDLIIPGTFLEPGEEEEFLARLRRAPPALVVWPSQPFDRSRLRGLEFVAPRVSAWVLENYRPKGGDDGRWVLMLPHAVSDDMDSFVRSGR